MFSWTFKANFHHKPLVGSESDEIVRMQTHSTPTAPLFASQVEENHIFCFYWVECAPQVSPQYLYSKHTCTIDGANRSRPFWAPHHFKGTVSQEKFSNWDCGGLG